MAIGEDHRLFLAERRSFLTLSCLESLIGSRPRPAHAERTQRVVIAGGKRETRIAPAVLRRRGRVWRIVASNRYAALKASRFPPAENAQVTAHGKYVDDSLTGTAGVDPKLRVGY